MSHWSDPPSWASDPRAWGRACNEIARAVGEPLPYRHLEPLRGPGILLPEFGIVVPTTYADFAALSR